MKPSISWASNITIEGSEFWREQKHLFGHEKHGKILCTNWLTVYFSHNMNTTMKHSGQLHQLHHQKRLDWAKWKGHIRSKFSTWSHLLQFPLRKFQNPFSARMKNGPLWRSEMPDLFFFHESRFDVDHCLRGSITSLFLTCIGSRIFKVTLGFPKWRSPTSPEKVSYGSKRGHDLKNVVSCD